MCIRDRYTGASAVAPATCALTEEPQRPRETVTSTSSGSEALLCTERIFMDSSPTRSHVVYESTLPSLSSTDTSPGALEAFGPAGWLGCQGSWGSCGVCGARRTRTAVAAASRSAARRPAR
eukprot:2321473-Prymnesium_polylepis.1